MATITVRRAVVLALAALTIGAGGAWFATRTIADRDLRDMILAHELETANLCAGGLKLEAAQRSDRLAALLEQRLDSAVEYATLMLDKGARLDSGMSSLRDAVRRASEHYAVTNATAKKQSADLLLARLERER